MRPCEGADRMHHCTEGVDHTGYYAEGVDHSAVGDDYYSREKFEDHYCLAYVGGS